MSSQQQKLNFLDGLSNENPSLGDIITQIRTEYSSRLWYQLGQSIIVFGKTVLSLGNATNVSLTEVILLYF